MVESARSQNHHGIATIGSALPFRRISASRSEPSAAASVENTAILVLHPRLQACRKAVVDGLLNTTPSVIPVLTKEYAGSDDDTIALVQRKMSWGERVRRGRDR